MTPASLREVLTRAGRPVPVADLLRLRTPAEAEAIRESMADLVEWKLAIDHGDTWQAVTGAGKAVRTATVVRVVQEGQRPLGVLPKMSEGSVRAARKRKERADAMIAQAIPRLLEGATYTQAGLGKGCMKYWQVSRPADYKALRDAFRQGQRVLDERQTREVVEAVRGGADSIRAVERACGMSGERASAILRYAVHRGIMRQDGEGAARRFRVVRRAVA